VSGPALNRHIHSELEALLAGKILDAEAVKKISARYPTTQWDVAALVRWFPLLGLLAAGGGLVVLAAEFVDVYRLAEAGLFVAFVALIYLGRRLSLERQLPRTGAALELMASLALQGLAMVLAIHFATGVKRGPMLLGIEALLTFGLAYALGNRLVVLHACILVFVWVGAKTDYDSMWGAYWLEMNHPLRFLLVGAVLLGVGWGHAQIQPGALQAFSRVYLHCGALVANLAMWLLALFGYFETEPNWNGNSGERIAFSVLWAVVASGFLYVGSRIGQKLLRSYGLVFLIINVYTFYFQFIVAHSGEVWFLHFLLVGGSLCALGFWLERKLRDAGSQAFGGV
jgi:hypothetical protein